MATKIKFIKGLKEVKKTAVNDLVNAGIRSGSTVGTALLLNGKLGAKIPAKIAKWRGPIVLGIGLLGDVFSGNDKMKAAFQGMTCYGALESTADIAFKGDGSKVGLATRKGVQGIGDTTEEKVDWDALAKKAEEEARMSGLGAVENEFTESVLEIIGEENRKGINDWLNVIREGKWGFVDHKDDQKNMKDVIWQLWKTAKVITESQWKEADDMLNENAMSGTANQKSEKSSINLD